MMKDDKMYIVKKMNLPFLIKIINCQMVCLLPRMEV